MLAVQRQGTPLAYRSCLACFLCQVSGHLLLVCAHQCFPTPHLSSPTTYSSTPCRFTPSLQFYLTLLVALGRPATVPPIRFNARPFAPVIIFYLMVTLCRPPLSMFVYFTVQSFSPDEGHCIGTCCLFYNMMTNSSFGMFISGQTG